LPNIREPKNGNVLVQTLFAENGSNCTGGLQKLEMVFELTEDGTKYIPGQGKYFIVPTGTQEGNTDWYSNPGVVKLFLRDGATAGNPTVSNLVITAKDANGTRETKKDIALTQTITIYSGPTTTISATPVCIVGSYTTGTIPVYNIDFYQNITIRYSVTFSTLIIGNTVIPTITSNINTDDVEWANATGSCGIPNLTGSPAESSGSFVSTAASETYYIDITFDNIYETNNQPFIQQLSVQIEAIDGTEQAGPANSPVATFIGNEALYNTVTGLIGTSCPTC